MFGSNSHEKAYLAPFLGFLLILALGEGIAHFFEGSAFWMIMCPRYWVFPLQTVVCGALLVRGWRAYDLRCPSHALLAAGVGGAAFVLWIARSQWLGWPARLDGFDPSFFGPSGWPYFLNVSARFLRLVVIVPLVEEIFWRGFLLRYLIDENFESVSFGSFSWKSFSIVTAGFCLEHTPADWPAAIITGILYNLLACRSRSLSACVFAHALTNLLLGIYVMRTGQWGFW